MLGPLVLGEPWEGGPVGKSLCRVRRPHTCPTRGGLSVGAVVGTDLRTPGWLCCGRGWVHPCPGYTVDVSGCPRSPPQSCSQTAECPLRRGRKCSFITALPVTGHGSRRGNGQLLGQEGRKSPEDFDCPALWFAFLNLAVSFFPCSG